MENTKLNRGGCYDCSNLMGTILNTFTGKTVAICSEFPMRNAPNPSRGCKKSDLLYTYDGSKRRRLRKYGADGETLPPLKGRGMSNHE